MKLKRLFCILFLLFCIAAGALPAQAVEPQVAVLLKSQSADIGQEIPKDSPNENGAF